MKSIEEFLSLPNTLRALLAEKLVIRLSPFPKIALSINRFWVFYNIWSLLAQFMNYHQYLRSLDLAALQLKFALQAEGSAHAPLWFEGLKFEGADPVESAPFPQRLGGMTYGGLHINEEDLKLSADDAALASNGLKHCSILTLAVVIDSAFENIVPDRFSSSNQDIKIAARIARILRNAYTHDPFFPKWNCTNENHIGKFVIPNVIAVDTTTVNGLEVEWQHYGGLLSLLLFLRHCQRLLHSYLGIEITEDYECIEVIGGLFTQTHSSDNC
ncbi:hypothetical protein LEP3755_48660 [Leptolyngbya sp. NIES-3755]|nr:hypothetical protein LEP3755_48660 [Leptolyngbya sp. NIES-3755]